MSLILDALRKMEQERKARKQGSSGMRQEVLNYRGQRPQEKSLILPVTVATGLLLVAVAAYLYLQAPAKIMTAPASAPSPRPLPAVPVAPPAPVAAPTPLPSPEPVQQRTARQPAPLRTDAKPNRKVNWVVQPVIDGSIVISGIAWQEERALRRAVVNGLLVGEGAEVQGMKVVEIRENRVLLSRNGSIFEVTYP